ncbi:GNAT family N-acetyltransferase [Polyangium aurulentum]|uniref:GNAT family N-acetyltransferase n=1 Tax=Polyangium aurulentum TaxID=2567896 RepID=UPI0010ADFDD9|nr:GNAT family N-acetyltransferase [Polyangium aurulentum]UQA58895.1 GNAT family N-acetyltransferase [Polyangium aurulentum]
MQLLCTVVTDIAELERMGPEWEDLLTRSDCNEPTLSPLWMLSWWRVFGPLAGRRLRAGVLRDGSRLVGIVPLVSRRVWHRPGVPFRRLEAMASGEPEEDEIASDYIGAVIERGAEEAASEALGRALGEGAFGAFDELVLPAMDGTRKATFVLADALGRRDLSVTVTCTGQAPYVPLPPTWQGYLGALSSSRRYLVNRSLRDFEAWAGGTVELREAKDPEQLERMRRTLVALHEERWQARGKEGVFGSPRFSAFHDAVMPALFERGALSLSELWARGEPVAALYNVVWNGKVYFYQSGRKPDLPGKLRPGIVAHALAMRRAIDLGLREYDFLKGKSRYKQELALASRPIVEVRAARRSLRETLRGQTERGIAVVRMLRHRAPAQPAHAEPGGAKRA